MKANLVKIIHKGGKILITDDLETGKKMFNKILEQNNVERRLNSNNLNQETVGMQKNIFI